MSIVLSTSISTTAGTTVTIGNGPPLTHQQLQDILIVAGHPRPDMTAAWMMRGTARPTVICRTAKDVANEYRVRELNEQVALLRSVVRAKLSLRGVQALDTLGAWEGNKGLSESLDISLQHACNLTAYLFGIGLLERHPLPSHLGGYLYRAVAPFRSEDE